MKKLLKRWLRQFLCEHKHTSLIYDIITQKRWPSTDPTEEPGAVCSETMYYKAKVNCNDCGKKNITVTYKA